MGAISGSALWAALATFRPVLLANPAVANVWAISKGYPGTMQPDHLWLRIAADVEPQYEYLTDVIAPDPSDETFTLEAGVSVTMATDDPDEVITRLLVGIAAVESWCESAELLAIVDTPAVEDWRLRDGVEDNQITVQALIRIKCSTEHA